MTIIRTFIGFLFSCFFIYICLLAGQTTIIIEKGHEVFKMEHPGLAITLFLLTWVSFYLELLLLNKEK